MSGKQKRALFALTFLVILPLLTGLACGGGDGDSVGEQVDKAVSEALKDFANGPSEGDVGDLTCFVRGEGGILVRAINCAQD